ncbi:helix-hairpin-helix domain-containing protein [Virgibacillus sp. W0430]|uniref:helix-hairpin-helix domain-containing protein n=1 Tax=Virgibacillus sp. W0430 TaxID=3391580 RepID=UPI003F48BCB6
MFEYVRKYLFVIIGGLILLVGLLIVQVNKANDFPADEATAELESNILKGAVTPEIAEQAETTGMIDLKGEVKNPGVYEFSVGDRVNDAIVMAGGFTAEADETSVNLAQKLQDEMVITVTTLGEYLDGETTSSKSQSGKVKINSATESEIITLNGIGPGKAEAIISYRDENGLFRTVEDLLNVSGIGEKTLERIREDIIVP